MYHHAEQKDDNKEPFNILGGFLREQRVKNGYSLKTEISLLGKLGIKLSVSGLSKIENRKRNISDYELIAFSKLFEVSVANMFAAVMENN